MSDKKEVAPAFSIIIPMFNEEKAIGNVVEKLKGYLDKCDYTYEIVVVDDGSTDGSLKAAQSTGVKVLKHSKNKGYGAALKTGVRNASYDVVIFYDADGQHEPPLLEGIIEGMKLHDMVVGARDKNSYQEVMRKPGKKVLGFVVNYLSRSRIPDINSGLRGIKKSLIMRFFPLLPDGFSLSTTITLALFKEGYSVHYVPITTPKRIGKSSVRQIQDGFNTLMLIVRIIMLFDPLRIFLFPSLIIIGIGTLFTVYTLIVSQAVWKSGLLLISVGALIFFFGLLADQISSIRRQLVSITSIESSQE